MPQADSVADDRQEHGEHGSDFGEETQSFPSLSIGRRIEWEAEFYS